MSEDEAIALYDILGSQAHVVMLCEGGIISGDEAAGILAALEGLKGAGTDGDTGAEDIHEYIEAAVIKKAGMQSGGKMHTARSRNDQVALDMRMKIRDDINTLCACLADTVDSLLSLAERHQRSIMPLYTHLQQAQAGTLSHYLLAQVDVLLRDMDRLHSVYGRINKSPLGAGPVGGTSIRIDRRRTAELLGFDGLVENSIDATSSRDFAAEYVAALAVLMTGLSRLSEDLVIWSSSEFSFIELSDESASPSSIMPQKKNPDMLELTRAKASEVIGNLVTVLASTKGLATGYGRDLQQIKSRVWSSSDAATHAVILVGSALTGMTVNEESMQRAAREGHLVALDVAEKMVLQGMPFRLAHRVTGLLVQKAVALKKDLSGLSLLEIREAVDGTGADPQAILQIAASTTVSSSLEDRISEGSSGFAEQKRMIQDRLGRVKACREEVRRRSDRVAGALADLSSAVSQLVG